jgi:hypothetical protein
MIAQETNPTLSAKVLVDSYIQYHQQVYGWEPVVEYVGNGWYKIETEVLHRSRMMQEIARLRDMSKTQEKNASKSMVQRLISKLLKI